MDRDDSELVYGLRRGDRVSFERAYAKYRARVYGFLLRLSGRADVAEDLLQETWMKLARSARSLREDTTLKAWLFTVARNEYLSYRRWSLLDVTRLLSFGAEHAEHGGIDDAFEDRSEAGARVARLERALAELPTASREVLLLVGVEGMDQEQVAAILGVSYAALRQRLSRARADLTERLEALERAPAMKRRAERGAT